MLSTKTLLVINLYCVKRHLWHYSTVVSAAQFEKDITEFFWEIKCLIRYLQLKDVHSVKISTYVLLLQAIVNDSYSLLMHTEEQTKNNVKAGNHCFTY